MRKFLAVAAFLAVSVALHAQISLPYPGPGVPSTGPSFVQATSCHGTTATGACTTSAITVTSGHTLAFCAGQNAVSTLNSLAISTGTNNLASFTQAFTPGSSSGATLDCRYLLSTNATGSTTFTATFSATNNMVLIVYELIVPNGFDGTAPSPVGTFTAGQTTINCPSYTTTHAAALVICAGYSSSGLSSATASSGFTIPSGGSVTTAGVGSNGAVEYQARVGGGTALTPSVTITSSSGTWGATFAFY